MSRGVSSIRTVGLVGPVRRRRSLWLLALGLGLSFTTACTSLDEDSVAPTTTTTVRPTPTTAAPTTTVPPTTVAPTSIAPPVTAVDGTPLPHTGPSEAAVLAAIGCALMVAGRLAIDGLKWLDQVKLAKLRTEKPPISPR